MSQRYLSMIRLAGSLFLVVFALMSPVAAGERLSVVELFTSQGCSSCPPADKLLGELAHRDDVLALSLPVDYWDYIGWKDTLASPDFSARQRAYAKARGDRAVYTPQAVVNGLVHLVGSDKRSLARAIRQTDRQRRHVAVEADRKNGEMIVSIGGGEAAGPARVLLVLFDPRETVEIGRGENAGRTITYHNVVRKIVSLGDWNGEPQRFTLPTPAEGRRAAIILQDGPEGEPGAILGAAAI